MRVVRSRGLLGALCLAVAAPLAAQQKPVPTPADYARWESISLAEISPDGRFFAHVVTRDDGDDELRIRDIARDTTYTFRYATRPTFAPGGRWLAWSVGISEAERQQQAATQPVRGRLGLMDLRTRHVVTLPDAADFAFSGDGRFLAVRGFAADGSSARGVDVVVRDLESAANTGFGNVAEFAWQPDGALLALAIDAASAQANGVRLYDPASGRLRTLHADTSRYSGIRWRDGSDDVAFLQAVDSTHVIHAWRGVARGGTAHTFDAASVAAFPVGYRVVTSRELRWSDDGSAIHFGIRAASAPADTTTAPRASVQVWHSADVDIIPEQRVRAGIERNRSYAAVWHIERGAFVQLGDEVTEDVTVTGGRWALGVDATPHDRERMFGPAYRDLWVIDVESGARERIAERVLHHYGLSETGRWVLYVKDGHYWTFDTQARTHTNITQGIATSFISTTFDFPIPEKPPFGTGGWTVGDRSVLLYDRYDVWEVRPDGSGARNMTEGAADRVRSRRVWLAPDDRVVDLRRPVYVALYGERTKETGYGRLHADRRMERLLLEDAWLSRIGRARDADVVYYRAERFDDSPDFFVADTQFRRSVQVTHTNPFEREYAWGSSELVEYRSATGQELQGALFRPAGYEAGRRYPLVVFPYELVSNTLHQYVNPSERVALNPTVFTQLGYFVLRPDVVFRARDPGVSSLEAILPAIDAVVATGSIDTARIGIVGHSWGGYQAAFAVTQTNRFAAAVAGAPLANMISMYLSIYWNSGGTDARMFEIDQGRMEVPFWDDVDAYMRNSPVFHIREMETPLLVAFGDRDGAVDWHQGIELYNAARRAGRQLVMLVYEGENHSLAQRANQVDYHRRVRQWLAHYLMGEPAPAWITSGEPLVPR
ncbi:MAG TPA: prolyl oligopeptidase family serine peptidase [Longimicrobiales bacterium]|nr:prolyl oligopeptidase family serine peptidase [Longimicrobiales bacterium]